MRRVTGVSKSTLPEATAAVRHPYRVILSIGGQTIAVDAPSFALANRTQKDWSWCLAASQQGQPELVVSPPAGRSASEWSRVIEREVITRALRNRAPPCCRIGRHAAPRVAAATAGAGDSAAPAGVRVA